MSARNESGNQAHGKASLVREPAVVLADGMVLTGATIVDEAYVGASALRGYFTDTLFRNCTFIKCSFRRCDFEAVVFEGCSFQDCDFGSSDFRSTDFVECALTRGNFPNGSTKGCKYLRSRLEECRFYRQSFEANTLTDCILYNCRFHRATVLHLELLRCRLIKTSLSDCTSLYHIFEACEFEKSSINVDTIALTYGLTRQNLQSLNLVWQGKRQPKSRDVDLLLQELIDTLMLHGWAIPTCVLALNFSLASSLAAFEAAFSALWKNILAGRPVRLDELQFLVRVIEVRSQQGRMPFLAVVRGLEFCARVSEHLAGREDAVIRLLAYTLKDAEIRTVVSWECLWRLIGEREDELREIEFVFDEAPDVSLTSVLQELYQACLSGDRNPRLISTARGSYIEVVCITLGTLMALNLALGMLVQTTGHLVNLRNKGRELFSPRLQALGQMRALEPAPAPSTGLGKQIVFMLGLLSGGSLPMLMSGADSIAENLQEIKVPEVPTEPPAS